VGPPLGGERSRRNEQRVAQLLADLQFDVPTGWFGRAKSADKKDCQHQLQMRCGQMSNFRSE
jgi:uncharacterized protein YbdZ (MbtH family)